MGMVRQGTNPLGDGPPSTVRPAPRFPAGWTVSRPRARLAPALRASAATAGARGAGSDGGLHELDEGVGSVSSVKSVAENFCHG